MKKSKHKKRRKINPSFQSVSGVIVDTPIVVTKGKRGERSERIGFGSTKDLLKKSALLASRISFSSEKLSKLLMNKIHLFESSDILSAKELYEILFYIDRQFKFLEQKVLETS